MIDQVLPYLTSNLTSLNWFLLQQLFSYSLSIFKSLFFIYPFNIFIVASILLYSLKIIYSQRYKESIKIQINFQKHRAQFLVIIQLKQQIYELKQELINKFLNEKENSQKGLKKQLKKVEKQMKMLELQFEELQKFINRQFSGDQIQEMEMFDEAFQKQMEFLQEQINCKSIVALLKKQQGKG